MFGFGKKKEARAFATSGEVPVSASDFLQRMGWTDMASGINVSVEGALGVPAIWAAVNFIPGTIAGLPLKVYRKDGEGRKEVSGPLSRILHDAVNDEMSSFQWRKSLFEAALTTGRGYTYIERTNSGRVANLWPIDPARVTPKQDELGRKTYVVRINQKETVYQAAEIIDVPFMLKADMVSHRSPIYTNKEVIGMAIAATRYGSKVFESGGLPPAVLQGPFNSAAGAGRASDDIARVMARNANEGKSVLALPQGHELKGVGFSPEDLQLLELQRFLVEQIARIYGLPPVFLQDLTHGTFSNTEQQDLHFVKHTIKRWVEQLEQELNLKLFGRSGNQYVEFSVDGLLRGDIKTRMEAHSVAIQNAIYSPAHASKMENAPLLDGADQLFIQGGTMPIAQAEAQANDE